MNARIRRGRIEIGTRSGSLNPLVALASIALIGLAASGCASATRADTPFSERESSIRLHVINLNWADARVYAHRSTQRLPLGSVPGKGEKSFTIDWNFSLPLRVEIDLLAGGRCTTRELSVDPGDVIELQIANGNLGGICE